MLTSAQLKHVVAEARPLIEKQLDLAEMIAGLRDVVTAAGGDWGQLKALIKAQIQDERDEAGDGKRVRKILDKADFASAYADMLGLAGGNLNEENFFDPETGEIQPGSTPEAGEGAAALAPADQSESSKQPSAAVPRSPAESAAHLADKSAAPHHRHLPS